jgi:hypothetical protein
MTRLPSAELSSCRWNEYVAAGEAAGGRPSPVLRRVDGVGGEPRRSLSRLLRDDPYRTGPECGPHGRVLRRRCRTIASADDRNVGDRGCRVRAQSSEGRHSECPTPWLAIVHEQIYPLDTANFRPILDAVCASDCDVLLLCSYLEDSIALIRALRAHAFRLKMVAGGMIGPQNVVYSDRDGDSRNHPEALAVGIGQCSVATAPSALDVRWRGKTYVAPSGPKSR